ncbi:MAG: type II secretion system minor pseudopilin GspI [Pseudomonadota bacterium]
MRKTDPQHGMTLLEVLVAILVLGTAVASLLALVAQQTRNADSLRENVLSRIAAENVMVQTILAEQRNLRDDTGTIDLAGQVYDWQVLRIPAPLEGLEVVTVEIRDPDSEDRVLAELTTLSPAVTP